MKEDCLFRILVPELEVSLLAWIIFGMARSTESRITLTHLPSTAPYAEYSPPISCDVSLLKCLSFPTKITSHHPHPTMPRPLSLLSHESQVPPQHSLYQLHWYHADGLLEYASRCETRACGCAGYIQPNGCTQPC